MKYQDGTLKFKKINLENQQNWKLDERNSSNW